MSGKQIIHNFESCSFNLNSVGHTMLLHGAMVSDFNGVSLNGGEIMHHPNVPGTKDLENWWATNPATTTIGEAIKLRKIKKYNLNVLMLKQFIL